MYEEGYEKALEFQWRLSLPHLSIIRNSDSRVAIHVPAFPGYELPAYTETEFGETITALIIPADLLQGVTPIDKLADSHSVGITSSTAIYSGDFFREGGKEYWDRVAVSDEMMRLTSHGASFKIQIDLVGEEWNFYAVMEYARRQALIEAVLYSDHQDTTQLGYENATKVRRTHTHTPRGIHETFLLLLLPQMPPSLCSHSLLHYSRILPLSPLPLRRHKSLIFLKLI